MLWGLEWVLAVLTLFGGLYVYGTWNHDYFKKRKFPYQQSPLPFVGNMGQMVFRTKALGDMVISSYNSSKEKCFGFFYFGNPSIMIRDPEIIKLVSVKDFDHFVDRVVAVKEEDDSFFGKNLLSLEGHRWKEMRSMLSPTFTSSKIKAMFVLVSESGEQLANHLERQVKGDKSGTVELDMKDLFARFANDVIATSAFGVKCDSLKDPENEFYITGKDSINFNTIKRGLIVSGMRICPQLIKMLGCSIIPEKNKQFFRSVVSDTIAVREREGKFRPDMIHLMLEARKENLTQENSDDITATSHAHKPGKKIELTNEDIAAQAFLFFLGGFDTSSTHLSYLSNLLATHPDIQERLQQEIDTVLAASGGKITYEGLQSMKYLDMCISEALRLWSPAALTNRSCVKPYVLPATETTPSFLIEKGVGVWIPIIGIHRDPKYFPDPYRFDPERFNDENKHNIIPYTYMPFGTGPRNCIGMRFALMEVKIAMTYLLARFDLVVTAKTSTHFVLDKSSLSMGVEGGFWLGIRTRTKKTE